MRFDHKVKYNGEYYDAGQEVPIGEPPVLEEEHEELPFSDYDIGFEEGPHQYTKEELQDMTVRDIKELAQDRGFEITKTLKEDVINEFLSRQ